MIARHRATARPAFQPCGALCRLRPVAREVRGAQTWARGAIAFSRGARFARPAMANEAVGVVVAPRGRLFRVLSSTFAHRKIVPLDVIGDPARLRQLELGVLEG